MADVTIRKYSDKNVLVQPNNEDVQVEHAKAMKRYSAKWNPRLKSGPGWLVPLEFESAVRAHFGLDDQASSPPQKFKPAPKKVVKKDIPKETPEDEEEPAHEEPVEEEPEPSPPPKKAPPKKATSSKASKPQVVEEDDDIVSISRRMKEVINRLDHLERRK